MMFLTLLILKFCLLSRFKWNLFKTRLNIYVLKLNLVVVTMILMIRLMISESLGLMNRLLVGIRIYHA